MPALQKSVILSKKSPLLPISIKSISLKRSVKQVSILSTLPNELIIIILSKLSNQELASIRLVNKVVGKLAETVLITRLQIIINALTVENAQLEAAYEEMYTTKKPQLRHFRGFLRNLPSTYLTEVTWYTSPPQELLSVAECLCILKNGPLSSEPGLDKWTEIKRQISRYDFKTWFLNLRKNVENLDISNVITVQNIIMHDPTITYERLREVSIAGYHLLIVVAASLQFGTIVKDLKLKKIEMIRSQNKLSRNVRLLTAISR